MLTLDLVRASVRQGIIKPTYLNPSDPELLSLASDLISLFDMHRGRPYGELKESLKELLGDGPEAGVGLGLARLLEDRAEIEMHAALEPRLVRQKVFEMAAPHLPLLPEESEVESGQALGAAGGRELQTVLPLGALNPGAERWSRQQVLEAVAKELNTEVAVLEQSLYADLPDAHVVRELNLPEPQALLHRYNLSLAQAVLLRAVRMEISLPGLNPARHRQLFRYIKFFRLMYSIEMRPDGGFQIVLDGPLSLFKLSSRYGLQLAELLPALVLCEKWTLEAQVRWGRKDELKGFKLSPKQGLVSHYPDTGAYESREEIWFRERFESITTEWRLEKADRILPLSAQEVVVPDLMLKHPDGRVAYLEIVGFWRRSYLTRRLEAFAQGGPKNLIVAVSRQLQSSIEGLEGFDGAFYTFREVLVPRDIVALAEKVGCVEALLEPPPTAKRKQKRRDTTSTSP